MLAWEQQQADALLVDVFGYHAVQLGWPDLQALRHNRMPHRWLAQAEYEGEHGAEYEAEQQTIGQTVGETGGDFTGPETNPGLSSSAAADVWLDSRAWPWPADSLDLVVLPHTLERSADPHACLREVARVLIPEGQLMITGLNPWSLWGWQQRRRGSSQPSGLIGYRRMRDWLRLLGFEVQISRFGGWTPALGSQAWMQRLCWMDTLGERWWPILGGVYLLVATKRVPGGRLIEGRRWRTVRSPASATAPVARSDTLVVNPQTPKDTVDAR